MTLYAKLFPVILIVMPPFCAFLGILIGFRRRIEFHYPVAVVYVLFLAAFMGSFDVGPFDINFLAMLAVFAAALGFLKPRESLHWAFFFAAFLALVEYVFLLTAQHYEFTSALNPLTSIAPHNFHQFMPDSFFQLEFVKAAAVRFSASFVTAAAASLFGIVAAWIRIQTNSALFDSTSGNKTDSDLMNSTAHTPTCIKNRALRFLAVAFIVIFYPVVLLIYFYVESLFVAAQFELPMLNVLILLFASFFLGALVAYASRPRDWTAALFGFFLFFALLVASYFAYVLMLGDSYSISTSGDLVREYNVEFFLALLPAMLAMTFCMLTGIFAGFKWKFGARIPIAVFLGLSVPAFSPGFFEALFNGQYVIIISIIAIVYGWLNAKEISKWAVFFSLIIAAIRHAFIVIYINRIVNENVLYPDYFQKNFPDIAERYPRGISIYEPELLTNTLWFLLLTFAVMLLAGVSGAWFKYITLHKER